MDSQEDSYLYLSATEEKLIANGNSNGPFLSHQHANKKNPKNATYRRFFCRKKFVNWKKRNKRIIWVKNNGKNSSFSQENRTLSFVQRSLDIVHTGIFWHTMVIWRHLLLILFEQASLKISPFWSNIYTPKVFKVRISMNRFHTNSEEDTRETSGGNSSQNDEEIEHKMRSKRWRLRENSKSKWRRLLVQSEDTKKNRSSAIGHQQYWIFITHVSVL